MHPFVPQALLQVTQALLEAIQVLASPVLIEDTTSKRPIKRLKDIVDFLSIIENITAYQHKVALLKSSFN